MLSLPARACTSGFNLWPKIMVCLRSGQCREKGEMAGPVISCDLPVPAGAEKFAALRREHRPPHRADRRFLPGSGTSRAAGRFWYRRFRCTTVLLSISRVRSAHRPWLLQIRLNIPFTQGQTSVQSGRLVMGRAPLQAGIEAERCARRIRIVPESLFTSA